MLYMFSNIYNESCDFKKFCNNALEDFVKTYKKNSVDYCSQWVDSKMITFRVSSSVQPAEGMTKFEIGHRSASWPLFDK